MTDQTMRASSAPQFTIGNVLGTSFSVLARNLLKFAIVPAVLMIPFAIVGFVIGARAIFSALPALQAGQMPGGSFFFVFIAIFLLIVIWTSLTSAVLVSAAFQALREQTVRLGSAFKRGFAALLPVVVTAILLGILLFLVTAACMIPGSIVVGAIMATMGPVGAFIGVLICLIPAMLLGAMFWLFTPAVVVEGKGIGSSMGRSRSLTKGHRWAIVALIVVLVVANWVIGLLNQYVVAPLLGAVVSGVFSFVIFVLWQAYNAIVITVSYYALRTDKEGISLEEIAKVFD